MARKTATSLAMVSFHPYLASYNPSFSTLVSISLNKPDACPYEPVTAQCNVTGPSNLFLSWSCDEERSVLCNQTLVNLDCEFGTVYDIASKCVCSDTVIISEATFDLSPMGDMMLYCSNRDSDQRQGVPVSAKGMPSHRPFGYNIHLRYTQLLFCL